MAIGTRTKEIGGITYEVQQHPARRAMRLLPRLGKLVGPLVGAVKAASNAGGLGEIPADVLARLVGSLFDSISPDEFDALLAELFAFTAIVEPSGAKLPLWPLFDSRMQGRPEDVLRLAAFSIEVNFSGFFDALRAMPAPGKVDG